MTTPQSSERPFPGQNPAAQTSAREIPSVAPGLLILAAGIVLLLSQMDMIALEDLWKFWPAGLILAGVSELEMWWKEQR